MSTLLAHPELGVDTITPRPYQEDGVEAVREAFRRKQRRALLVLATGMGKGIIIAKVCRYVAEKGGRTLVAVHTKKLVRQLSESVEKVGILCGIEQGENYARSTFDPQVVVACIPSIQKERLETFPEDHFKLVIIDECHHATSATYRNVLARFDNHARTIGMTATPDRADEDSIERIFGAPVYERDILWGIREGWLSRLMVRKINVDIDLRELRKSKEDFNATQLAERITPHVSEVVNETLPYIGNKSILCFTPDVASASAMATGFQSRGIKADWVAGDCEDQDEKINRYMLGDTQILCNAQLLGEGFDAPRTEGIMLCCPSKSRPKVAQQIGRGTRLYEGKEFCELYDYNFIIDNDKLVRPADLFDNTGYDPEILAIANEMVDKDGGGDLLDVVERAQEEHKRREVIQIQVRERAARARSVSYDPLAAAQVLGIVMRGNVTAVDHDPPSDGQCRLARQFGITNPESMSSGRLKRLLDAVIARSKSNLATHKQVSWCVNLGVNIDDARKMTKKEASAFLETRFGKRA